MRGRGRLVALFMAFLSVAGCGKGVTAATASASNGAPIGSLSAEQKERAMRIISVFENGTIELQFAYVENIGDGRGYTCGLGFTTRTADANQAAKAYSVVKSDNPLEKFLPRLQELADTDAGSVDGLEGFPAAWKQAAMDPAFQAIQVRQTDVECYEPAIAHAKTLRISTALGLTILYDTAWMHGNGSDPDGTPAILARAGAFTNERAWLTSFLAARRETLKNPSNAESREVWSQSVARVDVFSDLLAAGNFDLHGPIWIGRDFDVMVP